MDGELGELSAAVEVAAYRIITEALTNVVKHAGASRVSVRLLRRNAVFEAVVTDNGQGEVAPRSGGVGLESMALRAEELGGSLDVSNSPTGTTVHARLPL